MHWPKTTQTQQKNLLNGTRRRIVSRQVDARPRSLATSTLLTAQKTVKRLHKTRERTKEMAERLLEDCPLPGSRHTRAGGVQALYAWHAQVRAVHGQLQFDPDAEGLPGYVHGGALAAVLDEAMGMACWCEGQCAPGARIELEFQRPVRAGDRAEVHARVLRTDGRKLHCEATIQIGEKVMARAQGLFVAVPLQHPELFHDWPGLERFR